MRSINSISVKYAPGCIAVKEDYKSSIIYNTQHKSVEALFCVDRFFIPCKICTFRGNILTPISKIPNFDIDVFLRSKKGMYSRLDCVAYIVNLKGLAEMGVAPSWKELNIDIYTPYGVTEDNLILADIRGSIPEANIRAIKTSVVKRLGSKILTKGSFIVHRL